MSVRILIGDMRERLRELDDNSIDSCVCDPPYHLTSIVKRFGSKTATPAKAGKTGAYARASRGFMGQTWDGGDVAFRAETWAKVLRVLKPGAHLLAFAAPRCFGQMQVAIEAAGFEVRDSVLDIVAADTAVGNFLASLDPEQIGAFARVIEDSQFGGLLAWVFGSGFPKSHNLDGEHEGWGTALKPAFEPIVVARKPLAGTVAANVLAHGTGALNIDGCRVPTDETIVATRNIALGSSGSGVYGGANVPGVYEQKAGGRWPANVIHDGSDEVLEAFPETHSACAARPNTPGGTYDGSTGIGFTGIGVGQKGFRIGDAGGTAARFFYSAKTDSAERNMGCEDLPKGNAHPTVKPIDLMRWLCRLVTPPGGTVLDPFAGSGSTLIAADAEQFDAIGIELSPEYAEIAERRIRAHAGMFAEVQAA